MASGFNSGIQNDLPDSPHAQFCAKTIHHKSVFKLRKNTAAAERIWLKPPIVKSNISMEAKKYEF